MLDRILFVVAAVFFVIAGLIAAGTISSGSSVLWFDLGAAAVALGLALWAYPVGPRPR